MRSKKVLTAVIMLVSVLTRTGYAFQQHNAVIDFALAGTTKTYSVENNNGAVVALESLIEAALRDNPEILAADQKSESAQLRIPQAGAWPDPSLSLNIANFPLTDAGFTVEPMTQKQISLKQTIPFPGISSLKEQIAEEAFDIAGLTAVDTRNAVIKDISLAFFDIYLIDKSVAITLKNKQILNDFISIASKKYEVGEGLQQDVLKAQVEMSKLLDKLISYRNNREASTAELNALLNRPIDILIGPVEELTHSSVSLDIATLQQTSAERRPMLNAARKEVARREIASSLKRKQYWPDMTFGVIYGQRQQRPDFLSAHFSVNLPLWSGRKQDNGVSEALAEVRAAESSYKDMKNSNDARIAVVTASLDETDERIQLLHEVIIPQATQSLSSAISGYQVNKVDFLTLLNNQITLLTFELDYYRLLTEYKKNIANLEFLTGQRL